MKAFHLLLPNYTRQNYAWIYGRADASKSGHNRQKRYIGPHCSGEAIENSPAFQRRETFGQDALSPVGTAALPAPGRPYGTDRPLNPLPGVETPGYPPSSLRDKIRCVCPAKGGTRSTRVPLMPPAQSASALASSHPEFHPPPPHQFLQRLFPQFDPVLPARRRQVSVGACQHLLHLQE